jgi:hypothetical protein
LSRDNLFKDILLSEPYDELDFTQAQDLVKSRQRYFRRPKRPAQILGQLMARKGYAQTESVAELESAWNRIAGPKWNTKTKVGVIRRGVLEIMVSNSTVHQQLEFEKRKLLTELQQQLPKNKLKDLRFRIGNVS